MGQPLTKPISFHRDFQFEYGRIDPVTPLVRRVVAANPGPFTFTGTGTYIVGRGRVAVIDPGPDDPEHLHALLDGLSGETVTHILITHTHIDHSPLSRALAERTGARIFAYGPNPSHSGNTGEAGGDREFHPDETLRDGDLVAGDGWAIEVLHTPGHASNHLCFALREEQVLFTGDHVMGWSTSVISPPDGDMAAYVGSLRRLLARDDRTYLPTHGPRVDDTHGYVSALIEHRIERELEVLSALDFGISTIEEIVARVYTDLPGNLVKAAGRSVHAHLIDLERRGSVRKDGGGYTKT